MNGARQDKEQRITVVRCYRPLPDTRLQGTGHSNFIPPKMTLKASKQAPAAVVFWNMDFSPPAPLQ